MELTGEERPWDVCQCGHARSHHIYHEGACRPGFVCEASCTRFVDVRERGDRLHDVVSRNLHLLKRASDSVERSNFQSKNRHRDPLADLLRSVWLELDAAHREYLGGPQP